MISTYLPPTLHTSSTDFCQNFQHHRRRSRLALALAPASLCFLAEMFSKACAATVFGICAGWVLRFSAPWSACFHVLRGSARSRLRARACSQRGWLLLHRLGASITHAGRPFLLRILACDRVRCLHGRGAHCQSISCFVRDLSSRIAPLLHAESVR